MDFAEETGGLPLFFQSGKEDGKPNSIITKGPSDFGSDSGSPSGSHLCFTETEENNEEDDEYVAELTRQMANYMLQEDDKNERPWGHSCSPQSILWSPFESGYGSSIGPSREPTPPLIEKFEKIKIKEEISSVAVMMMDMNPKPTDSQSKQALIEEQIRAARAKFHKVRREMEPEKRERRQGNDGVYFNKGKALQKQRTNKNNHHSNVQPPGSSMKAVFLNGPGSSSGSGGTGVFLPRGTVTPLESRKKKGCSTVLIPARVVDALKLHFDKTGAPSSFISDFPPHHDALLVGSNDSISKQKGQIKAAPGKNHQDMGLPQEWTY